MAAAVAVADPDLANRKRLNQLINLYDPPKDLADKSKLNQGNTEQLKPLFQQYFNNGANLPADFIQYGNTKPLLEKEIENDETGYGAFIKNKAFQLMILRLKNSSGHDERLIMNYVSQDSGSKELTRDSTFIITPGTVLDPAGKTKQNSIDLVSVFPNLDNKYIEELNLQAIVDTSAGKEITMDASNAEYYEVTIPSKVGEIKGRLSKKTFKPIKENNPGGEYFEGNKVKNDYIYNLVKDGRPLNEQQKKEIMKYVLVKELGDTLQVQWLNAIFDSNSDYKRENTVIITCDKVVWWRAIVNKVGVLLTYNKKSIFYHPRETNEAQLAAIEAAMIAKTREEVITHNISVINTIREVVKTSKNVSGQWVNGLSSWTEQQIANAKSYLTRFIRSLENANKDIDIEVSTVATNEAAKEYASRSHFENPFTWVAASNYYKTNNKVLSILPSGLIKFKVAQFSPSKFGSGDPDVRLFEKVAQAGGKRSTSQKGGARRPKQEKINEATKILGLPKPEYLAKDISQRELSILASLKKIAEEFTEGGDVEATPTYEDFVEKANGVSSKDTIVGNANNFLKDNDFFIANVPSPFNIPDFGLIPFFLYIYIRDFYPQVFDYASMIQKAINTTADKASGVIPLEEDEKAFYTSLPPAQIEKFQEMKVYYKDIDLSLKDKYPIEYRISDSGLILREDATQGGPAAFLETRKAISLANYFITTFPVIASQGLADFFALIRLHSPVFFYTIADVSVEVELQAEEQINYIGGGTPKLGHLASLAADNYELYYSLAIEGKYQDRYISDSEFNQALQKVDVELRKMEKTAPELSLLQQKLLSQSQIHQGIQTGRQGTTRQGAVKRQISLPVSQVVQQQGMGRRFKKTRKQKKRLSKKRQRQTRKRKNGNKSTK